MENGFSYVARDDARILILGSMPGIKSLEEQQYYAHPRNAFWPVMGTLLNFDPAVPYEQRLQALTEKKVALWDVLAQCERPGSLDSAIVKDSIVVNDFDAFFTKHPSVQQIFCNGAKSFELYMRQVGSDAAPVTQLPSTSPANARMSFEEKLSAWSVLTDSL